VPPTVTLVVAGITSTTTTTPAVTATAAVPLTPSLVAVIVAVPAATPVTTPVPSTLATDDSLLAHVTSRPVNGLPDPSRGVAVSCNVTHSAILADVGVTSTDTTGVTGDD
jgi:hypothetical protein